MTTLTRQQVLRYRVQAQQLGDDATRADVALLDLGAQDTGEGALWALAIRGWRGDPADLVWAWTLRGAPHAYRRSEAAQVAAATAPYDEADAAKRVFDAAKKFKAAGLPVLEALDTVAAEMRDYAASPRTKGEMSAELTRRLADPYLRYCNPCDATHAYEQTFRLAALRGGLELEAGTSPPVLRRIPGWRGRAKRVPARLDVVRGALHLLGPSTPKLVAGFLDAPVATVKAHWPEDVAPVQVEGQSVDALADDVAALADAPSPGEPRLLGAFDLFLQGRDRELVLPDAEARTDLWRSIGRPGAVLVGGEIVGSWRPKSSGTKLAIRIRWYDGRSRTPAGLTDQAERLAAYRGQAFSGFLSE